ncbi:MAG: ribosome maturation factor RimP [Candidatus Nanopelagicales bacterium]
MSASRMKALRALAEPIVARFDVDLEEVVIRQAGKRQLVRVVVDAADGLTLDLVASISRAVSQELDDSAVLGSGPYVLEVTSPGVDRPLRLPRHWQRAVGRLVRVTDRFGDTHEGRLTDVRADEVILEAEDVAETIVLADVTRAVVQVEFSRVEDAPLDDADSDEQED